LALVDTDDPPKEPCVIILEFFLNLFFSHLSAPSWLRDERVSLPGEEHYDPRYNSEASWSPSSRLSFCYRSHTQPE
jgi:hypothetical protein